MQRLAIVTTHPIQYNAPLFAKLVERGKIQLRVFYTWERQNESIDPGFGKAITWDRPLLDGYEFQFSKNIAKDPGSHHYAGIDNPDLVTEVGDWKPDGILVYGWKFRSHLGLMRHFRGRVPILFRGDSHLLDEVPGWRSLARRAVIRFVMRNVDKALYVGEANKAYFVRHGVANEQLVRAPHAVDNDYFSADDVERRQGAQIKRQALGIDPDRVVILFAGKFIPKKAPAILLESFLGLPSEFSEKAHLVFVGDGMLKGELENSARPHENISFLPFQNQSEIPMIYRMADLFVLPSVGPGETWGLAVNEAMACGVPTLVSDRVGCASDLVDENVTGWVVEANDEDALGATLRQAIELGRGGLKGMGRSASERVRQWSYEETASGVEAAVLDC